VRAHSLWSQLKAGWTGTLLRYDAWNPERTLDRKVAIYRKSDASGFLVIMQRSSFLATGEWRGWVLMGSIISFGILLTASVEADIQLQCVESGFDAFLAKPVSRKNLLGLLVTLQRDRAARRADLPS
jgi:hypothetical protein